jgi:hypothetical protein
MKSQSVAISLFGGLSLFAGMTFLLTSFISFHPRVLDTAKQFMTVTFGIWAVAILATLVLSLTAVALAPDDRLSEARALRRRGLWFSLPQVAILIFLLIGGLLLARDIAAMGGH